MGKRQPVLATLLSLGLVCSIPPASAAQNVVFVSGAFRRSIPVEDLDHLARTGEARGLLANALKLGKQDPKQVSKLLNQSVALPVVLVSRLLNTRIGDAILDRLARIMHPLRAPGVGVQALRASVVLGTESGKGSLTPIGFLQAYPSQELAVNLPALMALVNKASSIAELVRFFSDSPLDGLRGTTSSGTTAQPAPTSSALDGPVNPPEMQRSKP